MRITSFRQLPATLFALSLLIIPANALHAQTPGTPTSAAINPASATISADQTQAFTMTATDANGGTADVTAQTTFSTSDPLGTMVGTVYQAGQSGVWTVQGTYLNFTSTATVTVTPGAIKELIVNPNSDPEFISLGAKKTFTARGYDADSNAISDMAVTWSVQGDIGSIDDRGVFTSTKLGTGKVVAMNGTIAGEVAVVVKEVTVPLVANANANTNTPRSVNNNTNAIANANLAPANANTSSEEPAPVEKTETCKTLATWVWVIILIVFLVGVSILYAFLPVSKIWPPVIALGAAAILVWAQREYGCSLLAWWGWVLSLGALGLSVLAVRQLPGAKKL